MHISKHKLNPLILTNLKLSYQTCPMVSFQCEEYMFKFHFVESVQPKHHAYIVIFKLLSVKWPLVFTNFKPDLLNLTFRGH